jgi:hypothetical protein
MNNTNEIQITKTKFQKELEKLINKYSIENHSNTPDFLLAQFIMNCLNSYIMVLKARDEWYTITEKSMDDSNLNEIRKIAKEKSKTLQCNCDLDNWQPDERTGHTWVCCIHKAAMLEWDEKLNKMNWDKRIKAIKDENKAINNYKSISTPSIKTN